LAVRARAVRAADLPALPEDADPVAAQGAGLAADLLAVLAGASVVDRASGPAVDRAADRAAQG
jgi:hypothetical protein